MSDVFAPKAYLNRIINFGMKYRRLPPQNYLAATV